MVRPPQGVSMWKDGRTAYGSMYSHCDSPKSRSWCNIVSHCDMETLPKSVSGSGGKRLKNPYGASLPGHQT